MSVTEFSRRDLVAMGLAGLALSACGIKGQGGGASVLRVGSQRGGTKALLLASGQLEGLPFTVEWSEFPAAQQLLEAVGSGAVDVGVAGDAPFLFAYQSGRPIKAVFAAVQDRPEKALAIVVPGASPAHDLADLRGKRIATGRGSIGHYLLLRALVAAKMSPGEIHIVFLSPSDAKAALQSGSIDGWSTWTPYVSMALAEGCRVLVDGKGLITGTSFEVANEGAIRSRGDLLKQFLEREARALQWAKGNSDAYARVLAKETGLPLPIAQDMAVLNARTAVPFSPDLVKGEQTVVDTFRAAGEIKGDRPLAEAFVTLA